MKSIPDALRARLAERGIEVPSAATGASDGTRRATREGDRAETSRETSTSDAEATLPAGWKQKMDETHKRVYYYNKALNKTQWERPRAEEKRAPPPPPPRREIRPTKSTVLPPGWHSTIDPTSGREYYFNPHTQKTSWERPVDAASAVGMKRCAGCGGFGRNLVESHGYCVHCSRVLQVYPPGVNSLDIVENKFMTKREKAAAPLPPARTVESKTVSVAKPTSVKTNEIGPSVHRVAAHNPEPAPQVVKKRARAPTLSKKEEDTLDPMDPAAYSDAPRGGWGAGIEKSRAAENS